jgi:hypothetical protein
MTSEDFRLLMLSRFWIVVSQGDLRPDSSDIRIASARSWSSNILPSDVSCWVIERNFAM